MQRASDITRARGASWQPADAAAYAVAGGRHGRHLESVTSYLKKIRVRQSMRIYLKNNPAKLSSSLLRRTGRLFAARTGCLVEEV